MERRNFIKKCCLGTAALPLVGMVLPSCGSIYYAKNSVVDNQIVVAKSEFKWIKSNTTKQRKFVMLTVPQYKFPICVYAITNDQYVASLLKCTHRGCELNVGGGQYTCPCHGSEFAVTGKVLEGPAEQDLLTFDINTDNENIYIQLF